MAHDYDKPIVQADTTGRVEKPKPETQEYKKPDIKISFNKAVEQKRNFNAFKDLLPLTNNVRKAQGNSPNKPTIPQAQTMEGG